MSKELTIETTVKMSRVLTDVGSLHKILTNSIQEVASKAVQIYKNEMPTMRGFGKHSVKEYKLSDLDMKVTSLRTEQGRPYLEYLHEGTGKLRGARDFGFHTGRVKAGDVARGIGGIRPNKFADRAFKRLQEDKVAEFILRNNIDKLVNS